MIAFLKCLRQKWGCSAISLRQNNGTMAERDRGHVIGVLQNLKRRLMWKNIYLPHTETHYRKRGYFRWGKISRKCCQDLSLGGNFRDSSQISLIKSYGFYYRVGGNFREEDSIAKNAKITPTRKFPRFQYLIIREFDLYEITKDFNGALWSASRERIPFRKIGSVSIENLHMIWFLGPDLPNLSRCVYCPVWRFSAFWHFSVCVFGSWIEPTSNMPLKAYF